MINLIQFNFICFHLIWCITSISRISTILRLFNFISKSHTHIFYAHKTFVVSIIQTVERERQLTAFYFILFSFSSFSQISDLTSVLCSILIFVVYTFWCTDNSRWKFWCMMLHFEEWKSNTGSKIWVQITMAIDRYEKCILIWNFRDDLIIPLKKFFERFFSLKTNIVTSLMVNQKQKKIREHTEIKLQFSSRKTLSHSISSKNVNYSFIFWG